MCCHLGWFPGSRLSAWRRPDPAACRFAPDCVAGPRSILRSAPQAHQQILPPQVDQLRSGRPPDPPNGRGRSGNSDPRTSVHHATFGLYLAIARSPPKPGSSAPSVAGQNWPATLGATSPLVFRGARCAPPRRILRHEPGLPAGPWSQRGRRPESYHSGTTFNLHSSQCGALSSVLSPASLRLQPAGIAWLPRHRLLIEHQAVEAANQQALHLLYQRGGWQVSPTPLIQQGEGLEAGADAELIGKFQHPAPCAVIT